MLSAVGVDSRLCVHSMAGDFDEIRACDRLYRLTVPTARTLFHRGCLYTAANLWYVDKLVTLAPAMENTSCTFVSKQVVSVAFF